MQFKQARNFSNVKPASERIRLTEAALRAAAQGCAPQPSSGNRLDGQLSTESPRGVNHFTKSQIVAAISIALVLSTLGMAVSLGVGLLANRSQQSQIIPSPVLTAPAFLEATAGENILLSFALDGTDAVRVHRIIGIIVLHL